MHPLFSICFVPVQAPRAVQVQRMVKHNNMDTLPLLWPNG